MRQILYTITAIFLLTSMAYADNGIISVKSTHAVKATADRLENTLKQKGMTVFIRIDHAAGAQKVGKKITPHRIGRLWQSQSGHTPDAVQSEYGD